MTDLYKVEVHLAATRIARTGKAYGLSGLISVTEQDDGKVRFMISNSAGEEVIYEVTGEEFQLLVDAVKAANL